MKKYIQKYLQETADKGNYFVGTRTELIEKFGRHIANSNNSEYANIPFIWAYGMLSDKRGDKYVYPLTLVADAHRCSWSEDFKKFGII